MDSWAHRLRVVIPQAQYISSKKKFRLENLKTRSFRVPKDNEIHPLRDHDSYVMA
jgi:hypothetical protein